MLDQEQLKTIRLEVEKFFEKMTISVEIESLTQKEETLLVNIKTEEPQILIGERGQTLLDIQRLLRVISRKKIPDTFFIDLDINNYKKKKIEYLKETARSVADEVALTRQEKILPPMPSYERRVIHLEIADRQNITTESIGQEPERRVIIKPYP
jgi:spoIIIJ-associated protein